MIMSAIIPLLGTVASLGGGLWAGIQQSKQLNKLRKSVDDRYSDVEGLMNKEYYQDAMQSREAQSSLARIREQMNDIKEFADYMYRSRKSTDIPTLDDYLFGKR